MKRGLRLEDSVEPAVALFAAWAWAWTGTFVSNLLGDGVVPEKVKLQSPAQEHMNRKVGVRIPVHAKYFLREISVTV